MHVGAQALNASIRSICARYFWHSKNFTVLATAMVEMLCNKINVARFVINCLNSLFPGSPSDSSRAEGSRRNHKYIPNQPTTFFQHVPSLQGGTKCLAAFLIKHYQARMECKRLNQFVSPSASPLVPDLGEYKILHRYALIH